jgi:hypothetical protein
MLAHSVICVPIRHPMVLSKSNSGSRFSLAGCHPNLRWPPLRFAECGSKACWRQHEVPLLVRSSIVVRADCAEHLRSESQSWFIKLHAFSSGMVNHFADVPATGGKRQMIHASHLLTKGADVKIINCLPQSSLRGRHLPLSVLSRFVHASSNLKCSRKFGNHAMTAGLMTCASASRASEIMRVLLRHASPLV